MSGPMIQGRLSGGISVRDARGRFVAGVQNGMQRVHHQLAGQVQAEVVQEINASITRRAVSTGRLARATADRRNRRAHAEGWGVGYEEFLDQSIAKYWRTIEEGSAAVWAQPFIGTELQGVWGGSITGFTAGRARAGKPITFFGANRQGKLIPLANGGPGRAGVVQREIQPMDAYGHVNATFRPGERTFEHFNDYLAQMIRAFNNDPRNRI